MHRNTWKERMFVNKCTSHPSNIRSWTPINLLSIHLKWLWVDKLGVFEANSNIVKLNLKSNICVLTQSFYVGWMRGTLVYDNPLSLHTCSSHITTKWLIFSSFIGFLSPFWCVVYGLQMIIFWSHGYLIANKDLVLSGGTIIDIHLIWYAWLMLNQCLQYCMQFTWWINLEVTSIIIIASFVNIIVSHYIALKD